MRFYPEPPTPKAVQTHELGAGISAKWGHRVSVHLEDFHRNGFAIIRNVFKASELENLLADLPNLSRAAGSRNLLSLRMFRGLAVDPRLADIVKSIYGGAGWPVRGIFFDKSPMANWTLDWHQDTKIAVRERVTVDGYTNWSTKEGIPHCRPPAKILWGMLALRISLDPTNEDSGPLKVMPTSHLLGPLSETKIRSLTMGAVVTCLTEPGDVVAMHPLTLHASDKSLSNAHRRVIHFEYATVDLDPPLRWAFA